MNNALTLATNSITKEGQKIPELVEVAKAFKISWRIITVLFIIVYFFILWRSVIRFYNDILAMRRGFYQFNATTTDSYNSLNYVAGYIGNAIFSYYFFFILFSLIITPLCIPVLYRSFYFHGLFSEICIFFRIF